MTAEDINHQLNIQFWRYDYRLNNSFIFNWESDFLCQSDAGYWVECEVKISRSDFLRDFAKEKHRLFQRIRNSATHYVVNMGRRQGDAICTYEKVRVNYPAKQYDWKRQQYIVNDTYSLNLWSHAETIYAQATGIRIEPMTKIRCPHQFYFAVPAGLITLAEIPDYAGLLYISAAGVEVVRRAPYLHKTKMDLTRELLRKYYNLWRFKSGGDVEKYYDCINLKIF